MSTSHTVIGLFLGPSSKQPVTKRAGLELLMNSKATDALIHFQYDGIPFAVRIISAARKLGTLIRIEACDGDSLSGNHTYSIMFDYMAGEGYVSYVDGHRIRPLDRRTAHKVSYRLPASTT